MRYLLSKAKSLLVVLFFALLIVVFVYGLGQGAPTAQEPTGYPGPELVFEQSNPYPGPPTPPLEQQNVCTNVGQWLTYTNSTAGYSLQYPAEADLEESRDYVAISLHPTCYGQRCAGSNQILIGVRENPQMLSLEAFIEQEFQLDSIPPNRHFVEVAGTQALRIEDGIIYGNMPHIFIPHETSVISIYVARAGNMPPFDAPCDKTLELLDGILASMELVSP